MKAILKLSSAFGEGPLKEIEIESEDIGLKTVNELFEAAGVKPSEIYANDALEITFLDFK